MSNIAQVLKSEILRLAKKETRIHVGPLKADIIKLKKSNVALRKVIKQLQNDNDFLLSAEKRRQLCAPKVDAEQDKARITAKGVRAMRRKLGLSQSDFGKLVGVSGITILMWEKKSWPLKVRDGARTGLLSLRGVSRKEARRRLELLPAKSSKPAKKTKKTVSRRRK